MTKEIRNSHKITNKYLLEELSKKIIGHNYAKKVLINMVNKIKIRALQQAERVPFEDRINPGNCLLIGDSGTGKTYLVDTLAELLDLPILKIDANKLSPSGASEGITSEDLKSMIKQTATKFEKRSFSLEFRALDHMIVFVDEIDKLAIKINSGGDWYKGVQASFLKIFENGDEGLKNITYIFAGAFAGIDKYENKNKSGLGFLTQKLDVLAEKDLTQSIIDYGLIPELVGRMNHIVLLDKLEEKDYREIFRKKIIPYVGKSMKSFGVPNFKLPKRDEDAIINKAISSGLGVRYLKLAINHLLVDYEFNPTSYRKNIL